MRLQIHLTLLILGLSLSVANASVAIKVPKIVSPNEVFNVSVEVNKSPSIIIGVIINFPEEFKLVNCSEPYKVSDCRVAIAIINNTKAMCTFKAPSREGTFTFGGKWIDMLNGGEGKLKAMISVGKVTATRTTATPTVTTPTVATTTTPAKATPTQKPIPGFEFATALVSVLLIATWRWLK